MTAPYRAALRALIVGDGETRIDSFDAADRILAAGWMPRPEPGSAEWEAMVERAAIAACGSDQSLKSWDEFGERNPTNPSEWWVSPEIGRNWWRGVVDAALRAALYPEEQSNG